MHNDGWQSYSIQYACPEPSDWLSGQTVVTRAMTEWAAGRAPGGAYSSDTLRIFVLCRR